MNHLLSLMNKINSLPALLVVTMLFACESRFPMEKRFWTPDDYRKVWYEIEFNTPKGEAYPRFSDPESAPVVRKIIDPKNYEVILEDPELGLTYRNEVSQGFFKNINYIADAYTGMDAQDKFIYAEELAELKNFFLGFQVVYFRVGNERIASQSDDKSTIRRNEQIIIENFNNHLEGLRQEKSYGTYAARLADGINIHFASLIETFPTANYTSMIATTKDIREKVETPEIKSALSQLITRLESLQNKTADPV